MKVKPTKKRWTKTEWLLLLAPLVIVIGIGAMNFAPQLQRAWREWREYGSNRPLQLIWASEAPNSRYQEFYPAAFSADGKEIAVVENRDMRKNEHSVKIWNLLDQRWSDSWIIHASNVWFLSFVGNRKLEAEVTGFNANKGIQHLIRGKSEIVLEKSTVPPQEKHTVNPADVARVDTFRYKKGNNVAFTAEPQRTKFRSASVAIELFSACSLTNLRSWGWNTQTIYNVQWKARKVEAGARSFVVANFVEEAFGDRSDVSFRVSDDGEILIVCVVVRRVRSLGEKVEQEPMNFVKAFDTTSGKQLWGVENSDDFGFPWAVSFSTRFVALRYRTETQIRQVQSGNLLRNIYNKQNSSYDGAKFMQFSPDGKLLAVPQDDRLELWDVSDLN